MKYIPIAMLQFGFDYATGAIKGVIVMQDCQITRDGQAVTVKGTFVREVSRMSEAVESVLFNPHVEPNGTNQPGGTASK